MSDATKSTINALLPPGDIDVFTASGPTRDTLAALQQDWRFARLNVKIRGENVDDALNWYAENPSPHLIILQVDTTDESLEKSLEGLSAYCSEGTAAIVIGPVNDVRLYRNLMAMGISDYLVAPVPLDDLISAIGNVLLDMMGTLGSQLIAVAGAKGGVGTSTVTQILAYALSDTLGQKTLLMDAAAGHSSLWSMFGFKPTRTIIEAAKAAVDRDHEELNQIMVKPNERLSVMNSGAERLLDNPAAPQAYEMLLDRMLRLYPYVLVDLSGAPELIQRNILSRANSIFVTSTPTLTALSMTRGLIKEIQGIRGGHKSPVTVVVNKRGQAAAAEVPDKDIAAALDIPAGDVATIDYQPRFFLGIESEGTPIDKTKDGRSLIDQMAAILARTINLRVPQDGEAAKTGKMSALLGLFKS